MQPAGGVPELQKYLFFSMCVFHQLRQIFFEEKKLSLVLRFKEVFQRTMAARHGIFSPFTTPIFCFSPSDLV